jgi:hypothetical protein
VSEFLDVFHKDPPGMPLE